MKPRLSILIPCYRVQNYIRQCLDSIISINLPSDEYEVLCFDDCSPDATHCILDEYAAKYDNIHVFHSAANIGPGGGRNCLFEQSKGRWIWFVDGDDMVISENVPDLLIQAENTNVDVLVFNLKEINADQSEILPTYSLPQSVVGLGRELADDVFNGGLVNNMGYPVRFLINRSYYERIKLTFPRNMNYGEDTAWMAKLVLMSERMVTTSTYGYVYWHHGDSTCGTLSQRYPGRTIYEKCIMTTKQLFDLVEEFRTRYQEELDECWLNYADKIEKSATNHYLNNLPIMLCRTTTRERAVFYKKFYECDNACEIHDKANRITRMCMLPFVGQLASGCLSIIYKISHTHK